MTLGLYVVPFLRYSASKNDVTLKLESWVVQGHWKWPRSIDHIGCHCKYSCMLYHFQLIWRWIVMTLKKSLKVIQTGTIRNLGAVSYSPSIVPMALSCIICEIKRDMGRKSWFFHTPLHYTPKLWGSPSEYGHPVWCGKTRMMELPDGEKTLRTCVTV